LLFREFTVGLRDAATAYLHETLGIQPASRPWSGTAKLPYHLQDEFELYELKAAGRMILLAVSRRKKHPTPSALRERLEKLKAAASRPVIYVIGAMASYQRKRLIEQKVPFIVPGNQLYLPDLGIDLREYFRQPPKEATNGFSPAAQALLLRALLSKSTQTEWSPAAMASEVGYTAMTVSRIVSELTHAGVAKLDQRGRARWLLMDRPPAETWELIRPRLRTPIKRQFWTRIDTAFDQKDVPLAGLSALAHYTQLADPTTPVYAVGVERLKSPGFKNLSEIPEPVPNSCQVQVWSYTPIHGISAKKRDQQAVDPLSLSLSFHQNTDERIELALDELKEYFPW
jgi:hypothetical protein